MLAMFRRRELEGDSEDPRRACNDAQDAQKAGVAHVLSFPAKCDQGTIQKQDENLTLTMLRWAKLYRCLLVHKF